MLCFQELEHIPVFISDVNDLGSQQRGLGAEREATVLLTLKDLLEGRVDVGVLLIDQLLADLFVLYPQPP